MDEVFAGGHKCIDEAGRDCKVDDEETKIDAACKFGEDGDVEGIKEGNHDGMARGI